MQSLDSFLLHVAFLAQFSQPFSGIVANNLEKALNNAINRQLFLAKPTRLGLLSDF
jgi:hypothetical protein